MTTAESLVAAIGAERHGIVTTALAHKAGVSTAQLVRLRRSGRLVPVGRGVQRLRDRPFDWLARCRAALDVAGDGSALGLRTAARLRTWYSYRDCDSIEVLVHRGWDHRSTIGRIVETTSLPADHVTEIRGLAVTTAARTFFDLCGDPDGYLDLDHPAHERQMARVYNDAVAHRGLTFTAEVAVFSALAGRGRAGTRLARRLLSRFGADYVPTQSETETLFLELVLSAGLPEPRRQVAISGPDGFIGVVDFLWPEVRHIAEVDSSWHDGPLDRERDAERDARLRAAGYTISRHRYGDIVTAPGRLLRLLAAATCGKRTLTAARTS